MIRHQEISLIPRSRGTYLITREILNHLSDLPQEGILHLYIKHTSAGITINEYADPSVRVDFDAYIDHIVPENMPFITHDIEGPDDMPAHIKASLIGSSVSIPISKGRLMLGTWQGVYLCEFRNRTHQRKLIATLYS